MTEAKKAEVVDMVSHLPNKDLFIHMISALKNESYLYAGILSKEIRSRSFSDYEIKTIKESQYYPMLNGVLD
ncbi:MAG: hypothetical protein ACLFUB_16890 [Cyclobacteriaceae bacterium]